MMAALLMAQAVVTPPPVMAQPATPTTPTEVSITRAAFDFDCTLIDASSKRFALAIEQRGGRGYVDPRPDQSDRRFRTTPLSFRVVKDETGLFASEGLKGSDAGGLLIETRHPDLGGIVLRTFPTGHSWELAAIVYVSASDVRYSGFVRYTGFCSATRHEQVPLTEAEAAEFIAS